MKLNLHPTKKEARKFAWTWMAVSAILGGLLFWRHHPDAARGVWIASATVGILGTVAPPAAKLFYRLWMSLAFGINTLIARLLLAFIFYGVITPMALFFKVIGRDALERKKGRAKDTYWHLHDKPADASSYRHLY